jgi:hypothetical protein
MADQLPSVNFNFDDLRERMARFQAKFDRFIDEGRKRVLEEKNQFRINLAELHGMIMFSTVCPETDLPKRIRSKPRAQWKSRL